MSEKMMTWEELNPDWREYGDLTERFAQSQFDNCPGCGHFGVRVYIGSEDDEVCVICTGCEQWQAWGDCPSEAIDTWNKRVDAGAASVDRVEIVREAFENGPKHKYWGAGEPDCPKDIKGPNGELHTVRCKFCDHPKWTICIGQMEGD